MHWRMIFVVLLGFLAVFHSVHALSPKTITQGGGIVSRAVKYLSQKEVDRLAELASQSRGTVRIGEVLGSQKLETDVVEEALLRVAIKQKRISLNEARRLFLALRGAEGFPATLKKVIGNNARGTVGHLNELFIARSAAESGYKVVAIGKKFNDGIKRLPTDIDILLQGNGRQIAIEAKAYNPSTALPLDKFRADMDTLLAYQKRQSVPVLPVFSLTAAPDNRSSLLMLQKEALKRGVQLIVGSPQGQVEQIRLLEKVL